MIEIKEYESIIIEKNNIFYRIERDKNGLYIEELNMPETGIGFNRKRISKKKLEKILNKHPPLTRQIQKSI